MMQTFTLSHAKAHHGEVFEQATSEPILLTRNGRSSHVVMSADHFDRLMGRLQWIEDQAFGRMADAVKASSPLVGSDVFEDGLKRLANAED